MIYVCYKTKYIPIQQWFIAILCRHVCQNVIYDESSEGHQELYEGITFEKDKNFKEE